MGGWEKRIVGEHVVCRWAQMVEDMGVLTVPVVAMKGIDTVDC